MPVSGSSGSSSAAAAQAAAEARQREIEEEQAREAAARRQAEAAAKKRQAAQAAQQRAKAAQAAAAKAQQAARQKSTAEQAAKAQLQAQKNAVAQHPQLAVKARSQIDAAQKQVEAAHAATEKAQAKAQAAAQKATEHTTEADGAADKALQSERAANTAYQAIGKPAPFAAAQHVSDAYGAVNLSGAQQNKLFGSTLAVSDAAHADAARLSNVRDPGTESMMLKSMLHSSTDALYQKALIQAASPQLKALASKVCDASSGLSTGERQQALNVLTRASNGLRPDAQQALATAYAAGMKNADVGTNPQDFGTLLKNSIQAGNGSVFGVRLASALQSEGKADAAKTAAGVVSSGIDGARTSFDSTQKKLNDLQGRLASEISTWKLQGKDLKTAVAEFDKQNHVGDLQKQLEQQGSVLASTFGGADIAAHDPGIAAIAKSGPALEGLTPVPNGGQDLVSSARSALHDFTGVAQTNGGRQVIEDAVKAEGEGESTFLEHMGEYAEKGESATRFLEGVHNATVSAIGAKLLERAQGGQLTGEGQAVLAGLKKDPEMVGLSKKTGQHVVDALSRFKPGMSQAELEQATASYKKVVAGAAQEMGQSAESSPTGLALKGLGVGFGVASAVSGWSQFGKSDLQAKIATVVGTLGTAKDAQDLGTLTVSILKNYAAGVAEDGAVAASGVTDAAAADLGADAGKLGSLGVASDILGKGLGAVGVGLSAYSAFNDFSSGRIVAGIGDSLGTVGGAIMLGSALLPPGLDIAGEVVGGLISAAGAIVSLFSSPPDPFATQEGELKNELESIGVNGRVAGQLDGFSKESGSQGVNFGSWVSSVAKASNMSTADFVRAMNNWSDTQIQQFLDAGRLQLGTDGNNPNRVKNASQVLGSNISNGLEDPQQPGIIDTPQMQAQQARQAASQRFYRAHVDDKTGSVTYDAGLVQLASGWAVSVNEGYGVDPKLVELGPH